MYKYLEILTFEITGLHLCHGSCHYQDGSTKYMYYSTDVFNRWRNSFNVYSGLYNKPPDQKTDPTVAELVKQGDRILIREKSVLKKLNQTHIQQRKKDP